MSPTLNPSISSSPSLSPTIESLCPRSVEYSDGTAGNLTLDATTGALTLNGDTNDSRFLNSTTLGLAHDVTTVFDNIENFVIPADTIINSLGKTIINAKRIVIEGTLNGNGGGYPGAVATTTGDEYTDTYRAWSGTTPMCVIENEDRSKYLEYSTVNHVDGNGQTPTPRTPCIDEKQAQLQDSAAANTRWNNDLRGLQNVFNGNGKNESNNSGNNGNGNDNNGNGNDNNGMSVLQFY